MALSVRFIHSVDLTRSCGIPSDSAPRLNLDPRYHKSGEEKTYVYKYWLRQLSFFFIAAMFQLVLVWHDRVRQVHMDVYVRKANQVSNARAAMFTSMFVGVTLKAVEPFDCTLQEDGSTSMDSFPALRCAGGGLLWSLCLICMYYAVPIYYFNCLQISMASGDLHSAEQMSTCELANLSESFCRHTQSC